MAICALLGGSWLLAQRQEAAPANRPHLGLFTTLPILWGESASISEMLATPPPPHWAKAVLDSRYRITPLDVVEPGSLRYLLIAQPRPLAPAENVALDDWVRRGGRVLLFADPMLTWHSTFSIGDKRRPQDVVLLSPILARWGLELRFDEGQGGEERTVSGLPIRLAGTLALTGKGHAARCTVTDEELVAECRIGKGTALVVADAALLEPDGDEAAKGSALESLLDRALGQ